MNLNGSVPPPTPNIRNLAKALSLWHLLSPVYAGGYGMGVERAMQYAHKKAL